MLRRDFILKGCMACIGGLSATTLLQSCGTTKHINANIIGSDIIVPLSNFEFIANNKTTYKKYLIIQNNSLQYPICVYRINEKKYTALWMRCTHQGAELVAYGDVLQCPAHGAEFNNNGIVTSQPATENLKTFAISIEINQLKISLK